MLEIGRRWGKKQQKENFYNNRLHVMELNNKGKLILFSYINWVKKFLFIYSNAFFPFVRNQCTISDLLQHWH